jgi:hypothetical protein
MSRVAVAVPLAAVILIGLTGCRDDGSATLAPGPARPATVAPTGLLDGVEEELDALERDIGRRDPDAGGGAAPAR